MRKNPITHVLGLALVLVLVLSACKSSPPAKTPAQEPAPVATPAPTPEPTPAPVPEPAPAPAPTPEPAPVVTVKPVDDALTALKDKATALRTEGLKYGLNTFMSAEWADAESAYQSGQDAYGKDYDLAQKSFEDAIARYESIRAKAFAAIAADLENEVRKAREEAVAAGALDSYPEQFALADTAADLALSHSEEGDFALAYDTAQIALMRYKTLLNGMIVADLNKTIVENDFAQYAPDQYAQASIKYDEAVSAYGTADAAALESSIACVTLGRAVKNAGFKALSENLAVKLNDVRAQCVAIKAPRSAKAAYAQAEAIYKAAYDFAESDNWESAYYAGNDAYDEFSVIYQEVTLKKNAADVAISMAKSKQAESSELALRADQKIPLAADAEGYSEDLPIIEDAGVQEGAK